MSLTVRCPACRLVSGVDPADRGEQVRCPNCRSAFTAVPEADLVIPSRTNRNPLTLDRRDDPSVRSSGGSSTSPDRAADPDHDPHRHPVGGLPASVLIGLALLPFAIPVLWVVVPAVLGQPPLLSVGVPCAIALSASVLSLAVIYTIDWSPSVRVKGVIVLLALAYFSAGSLFFLKKEMVEWFKAHLGKWVIHISRDQDYRVLMPNKPAHDPHLQPVRNINLDCYTASHEDAAGSLHFVVGAGSPKPAKDSAPGSDPWFEEVVKQIVTDSHGRLDPDHKPEAIRSPPPDSNPGRQFALLLDDDSMRLVRLFFFRNRLYYLSVEGASLTWNNSTATAFFDSFRPLKKR